MDVEAAPPARLVAVDRADLLLAAGAAAGAPFAGAALALGATLRRAPEGATLCLDFATDFWGDLPVPRAEALVVPDIAATTCKRDSEVLKVLSREC